MLPALCGEFSGNRGDLLEKRYLGIDIGGTKCAVTLGALSGGEVSISAKVAFPTQPAFGLENTLKNLFDSAGRILSENGLKPEDIAAAGISCGGPLNSRAGMVLSPPNLPGWDNVPIVRLAEEKLGIKTFLQNDANACALAEWKFGAAKGFRNAVFLTFGTGMGAGLILNGRLYDGAAGMAGEIGHVRFAEHGPVGYGKEGSFEGFCSGGGIAQMARTKAVELLQSGSHPSYCSTYTELDGITAKTVAAAADRGDTAAIAVYAECAEYLGRGLAVLIDLLNPEAIVIGSIYGRSENLLKEGTLAAIRREAIACSAEQCRILPAMLGNRIGDIAAVSVAADGDACNGEAAK